MAFRTVMDTRNSSLVVAAVFAAGLLFCGCATTKPRVVCWQDGQMTVRELDQVLRSNRLGSQQNVRVTPLQQTERASVHLVQVRTAEVPHKHETHDLTVFVVRGSGEMVIGDTKRDVRAGDAIHIPAGVRHYFTNRSPSASVAVVVYSPPFDGKDTVQVE